MQVNRKEIILKSILSLSRVEKRVWLKIYLFFTNGLKRNIGDMLWNDAIRDLESKIQENGALTTDVIVSNVFAIIIRYT